MGSLPGTEGESIWISTLLEAPVKNTSNQVRRNRKKIAEYQQAKLQSWIFRTGELRVSEPVTVPKAGAGPVPTEPQSSLYLFASWTLCLSPLSLPTEPIRTLHLLRRPASFLLSLEYLRLLLCPVVAPGTSVGSKGQHRLPGRKNASLLR